MCTLALEMASPRNQHCANCIGTLSFPIEAAVDFNMTWWSICAVFPKSINTYRAVPDSENSDNPVL